MLDSVGTLPPRYAERFRQANPIGGSRVQAEGGRATALRNPAAGEVIGEVPAMSAAETRLAIETARAAFGPLAARRVGAAAARRRGRNPDAAGVRVHPAFGGIGV